MEELGCQTICIKDMAGILGPKEAYDMVKALKENVKTPIILHTHLSLIHILIKDHNSVIRDALFSKKNK